MKRDLLIVGAGIYGLVAKEIAESTGLFSSIAFVDDGKDVAPDGSAVVGKTADLPTLSKKYSHAVVALGNPNLRKQLTALLEEAGLTLATLLSPRAHVSPSARLKSGCIVEPMAVVHANCLLGKGCFVCAGAVVNHQCRLGDFVQVDCNATVSGFASVPEGVKIPAGTVYQKEE